MAAKPKLSMKISLKINLKSSTYIYSNYYMRSPLTTIDKHSINKK